LEEKAAGAVTTILVDHNMEGHAVLLWGTIAAEGWFDLLPLHVVTFQDFGLPFDTGDRLLWRFAQSRQLLILTANRNMRDSDSLEQDYPRREYSKLITCDYYRRHQQARPQTVPRSLCDPLG
jgi:hypothetical protein